MTTPAGSPSQLSGYGAEFVPVAAEAERRLTRRCAAKKRQRQQGTQTAEDYTKREECPECVARGIGAVLDFGIVWKEDDRRDTHGRAECDAMRDRMPPVNMVMAAKMLVAQATTVRLVETKVHNFDTLRNMLALGRELIPSILFGS